MQGSEVSILIFIWPGELCKVFLWMSLLISAILTDLSDTRRKIVENLGVLRCAISLRVDVVTMT